MLVQIKKFLRDEEGATAVEYGLIAALIAVAILSAVSGVGDQLESVFVNISAKLAGALKP